MAATMAAASVAQEDTAVWAVVVAPEALAAREDTEGTVEGVGATEAVLASRPTLVNPRRR